MVGSRTATVASSVRNQQEAEFLRRVAAGTAHDLNNLLLVVIGCAELALDDRDVPPHARKLMHDIVAASARAAALTRQFLALGKPPAAAAKPIDAAALLRSLESLLGLLAGDRVRLCLETGTAPLWVLGDATQLEQVIVNLALNARDAMPGGGILSITAGANQGQGAPHVRLTVVDTGVGIEAAIRERMFDAYVTTKGNAPHFGLGLAVVRDIVDQLHGTIHVTTASGRGTTFTIDLPRAPEPGPAPGVS